MTETKTDLHIRFLTSGQTYRGQVWRRGQVAHIKPDDDRYDRFSRTESEQRERWGEARWEHITAEQYATALGAPSLPPEPARPQPVKTPPPPPEDGAERTGRPGAPAPTSHTPAADPAPPTTKPEGTDRWPWYPDANVDDTLARVADMSESEAVDFLAYEIANKNRKGITGPMTGA